MQTKISLISDEDFSKIIKESTSYAECCRKIGYSINGKWGTIKIKERCQQLGLSTNHFSQSQEVHGKGVRYTNLDDILIENSPYKNINSLKNRLINEGKMEYKCVKCGNLGEWLGKPLSLQLDHINGNPTDHRLSNLQFLCPNCHSQTETFSGKNKKSK